MVYGEPATVACGPATPHVGGVAGAAVAKAGGHVLLEEGLRKIGEKFASPDHVGPKFVADFEEIRDPEELLNEILRRSELALRQEEVQFRRYTRTVRA